MNVRSNPGARTCALLLVVLVSLAGCESMGLNTMGKRIDYKSAASAPSLELPPDLTQPTYDDRFSIATASGVAARDAAKPNRSELLPTNPEAHIVRAGTERWLVVKATPEQAWSAVRKFWTDTGFVIA
ncbi:MAG TPA: outer membrane protein assembly factor BamC, partial [Casimicrobiaceae bacterium]|nr:outer membrane protein assembly factor BamC [Casimicrobiaceae bacterium]